MSDIARRIASLSPEQKALLEKRLSAGATTPTSRSPIAILGMGCRFPGGADSPDAFWRLLREGRDAIREVPRERWDIDALYDPDPMAEGKISSRWGGFLEEVDRFDAGFFGISPREAVRLDPQQRLLLEVAWDALEDAAQTREGLAGSATGVFVGAHSHASDYLWLQYLQPDTMDAFVGTGTAHNLLAGRLSYFFDLHGPAVVVDTACSSSLVAVHLAAQSLRLGESDLALAAGVNLMLTPHFTIAASRMHMLAPDGRCKAFDHRADGFVRGEGCGVVVLKRLSDAVAAGDPVVAVIRGSATNQDGHTNGITAPNGLAQRAVIEHALKDAGVVAHDIGYVETHGTGTSLGDPIEIEALGASVGRPSPDGAPCFIGSAKTNVGHMEGAAGIAGLIKAALVLRHAEIPPLVHFTRLNPHIEAEGTRFCYPTEATPWPANGRVRRAGVSSFGWSGTNAHLVLEEAPLAPAQVGGSQDGALVLPVSARSEGALIALVGAWQERLAGARGSELRDLCFTAAVRRSHHDHRVAAVGRTGPELSSSLEASLAARVALPTEGALRVVFVFPGQGSQWLGMGRSLLREEPAFREAIERCDAAIAAEAGWSLIAQLQAAPEASRLRDIDVVQPTLFAVEVALAELWRSWGILPDAVVGHSMGEVAAAHVAGALSLEDATRVICRRSRLLRGISGRGAMAVVELSVEEAARALAGHEDAISVAVSNGPRSTVISGDPRAIEEVMAALQARDVFCRPVKVDVASHSPQVDGLRAALLGDLADLRPGAARVPILSTVTASVRPGEQFDGEYWVRNLREPVRFFDALLALLGAGHSAFIEASPHPILLPAVEDAITHAGARAVAVPSLRREEDERGTLLAGLAGLFAHGADPAWPRLLPEGGAFVAAPRYPWQRERFWLENGERPGGPADVRVRRAASDHPLLGSRVEVADLPGRRVWENDTDSESSVCQYGHVLHGRRVLGAGGYAAIALAAWAAAHGPGVAPALDLELREPLPLPPSGSHTCIQVILEGDGGVATLQVYSRTQQGWLLHVRAELRARPVPPAPGPPVEETRRQLPLEVSGESYYQKLAARGVGLVEGLDGLTRIWADGAVLLGECATPGDSPGGPHWPTALLDAAFQLAAVRADTLEAGKNVELRMPVRIEGLWLDAWDRGCRWVLVGPVEAEASDAGDGGRAVRFLGDDGRCFGEIRGIDLVPLELPTSLANSAPETWVQAVEWRPLPGPAETRSDRPAEGRWLVLSDRHGVGTELGRAIEGAGGQPLVAYAVGSPGAEVEAWLARPDEREDLSRLLTMSLETPGPPLKAIVHLWSLDSEVEQGSHPAEARPLGSESLLAVLQALAGRPLEPSPRLFAVTRGAQAVVARETVAVASAPVWGLGRVAAEEHPECWGGLIDIDPAASVAENARHILGEITRESEDAVAFRRGRRYAPRLVPAGNSLAPRAFNLRQDGAYLVTGGLGSLGLEIARWLASRGARHLILMGRTALPPRERWDEALSERETRAVACVRGLEAAGATVRLVSADVADEAAVGALLEQLRVEGWPSIRGVVHAAGVIDDRLIADMDGESLRQVLRPKVVGSWRLHEALSSAPLDFFVLFSSLGSLLGQAGQASYAAANAFLDALAHLRRAQGLAALAVNWGAWEGRGFASTAGGARTLEALAAQGISSFRPEDALGLLGRLLATEVPQAVVMPFDPERFVASGRRVPPLLAELCRTRVVEPGTRPLAEAQRRLLVLEPQDRRAFLEKHLQEQLSAVLKVPEARIELHRPLGSLGLESLTALELRKRLEATLGLRLSATIVWNYPTVAALAQHLEGRLEGPPEPATRATPAAAPANRGTALAALQHLSEEDALRRLLEKGGSGQ